MTITQWLIGIGVAVVVGWIILQPQRWGKRDSGDSSEGGFYASDGSHRRGDDDDGDSDGDGGDDGGGGD